MSVQEFLDHQARYLALRDQVAPAYLLIANMIWNRAESITPIALFDTPESAEQYIANSKLPEPEAVMMADRSGYYSGEARKMWLSHREGSLLREFNGGADCRVVLAPVDEDYRGIPINPVIGEVIEAEAQELGSVG